MLDSIALGLVVWTLLAVAVAVVLCRGIDLADRRAAGGRRHAPPAGWLERQLPAVDRPATGDVTPRGLSGRGG